MTEPKHPIKTGTICNSLLDGLPSSLNVLLLDDDPIFGRIVKQIGPKLDIEVAYYKNVCEMGLAGKWDFDAAIVDYDLGTDKGTDVAHYIELISKVKVPIVLVSNTTIPKESIPNCVDVFVNKQEGPVAILEAILGLHRSKKGI